VNQARIKFHILQELYGNLIVLRDAVAMELDCKPHLESLSESLRALRRLIAGLLYAQDINHCLINQEFLADAGVQFIPSPLFCEQAALFGLAGLHHAYGLSLPYDPAQLFNACKQLKKDYGLLGNLGARIAETRKSLQRLLIFSGHVCELIREGLIATWEEIPPSERPARPVWQKESDLTPSHQPIFSPHKSLSEIMKRKRPVTAVHM